MAEDLQQFELETISDSSKGVLAVKDFESTIEIAKKIVASFATPEVITSREQRKACFDFRANCNHSIKQIDRERIDTIEDFTSQFAEQCNAIKAIFDEKQKEIGEKIKAFDESQKLVSSPTVNATKLITAKIKFPNDEKLIKKLTDFCAKNGIELSLN